jgi:hypothetical protein
MIEKQKNCEISVKTMPERNSSSVAGLTGPTSLPDDVLEKLYRSYSLKQKRSGLTSFIVASIVFDCAAILVPQGQSVESLGELIYIICYLILCKRVRKVTQKAFKFPLTSQSVNISSKLFHRSRDK